MKELKQIDYSCLVGSQVLMEFWSNDLGTVRGFLSEIFTFSGLHYGCEGIGRCFENCRIYQHPDYEISNAKGDLVLPEGLRFDAHFRCGLLSSSETILDESAIFKNYKSNPEDDIIAIQITGPAKGYKE